MPERVKFTNFLNGDGSRQAVALDKISFDTENNKLTLYSSIDSTIKEETIIPASEIEVDDTLTEEGMAADAKATGDAIKSVVQVGGQASEYTGIIVSETVEEIELVDQATFDAEITRLNAKVGAPLVATTVAQMINTDKIYVYTGSETGYMAGNWYYYNGSDWTNGGVYNAVAVETDTTLSISGKAADAKKVGDELADVKEGLNITNAGFSSLLKTVPYDYTGVEYSRYAINSYGKWTHGSVQRSYTFAIPSTAKAITVTANTNGAIVAFLDTYPTAPSVGDDVDFSDRYSERIVLSANETKQFIVDGNYFYVLLQTSSSVDYTPVVNICYEDTDDTLTQAHVPADSETVGKRFGEVLATESIDYANVESINKAINTYDKWTSGTNQRSFTFSIDGIKRVKVTGNTANGSVIAFLNTFPAPVVGESPDFATDYPQRIDLEPNEIVEYSVVGDMHYIYTLLKGNDNTDYTPTVDVTHLPTDKTFTREYVPADSATIGQVLAKNFPETKELVEYVGADANGYGISSLGKWTASSVAKYLTFRLDGIKKIKVTANATNTAIIAFLNSYAPVSGEYVDFATGYTSRITLQAEETAEYNVTDGMNYLFVMLLDTSANDHTPVIEVVRDGVSNMLYPVDVETADETGKTDRSEEINAILATTGYCHLAKGVYYIGSGIKMPVNSMLVGSGADTVIKLLDSVTEGTAIVMGASCTVKDLKLTGGASNQYNAISGDRHGIEWTGEEQVAGHVSNCFIRGFDGSGIYLHDTTQKTYRGLSIVGCYITNNRIGVYIRKDSEFNKITACTITANGIGYLNRGGNNDLSCSGLDANKTGILIDDDEGDNGGHGTISGCSAHHSNSNNGYSIIIKGTGRMLVSGCNLGYGKLRLENTNGNVFSGCGFFRLSDWEIVGGENSLFIGCMVRGWGSGDSPVTITNNTKVKIVNCFDREGVAYEDYSS